MSRHDDHHHVVPERERKLRRLLTVAFERDYGLVPPAKRSTFIQRDPTFRASYALQQFFDVMSREGEDGLRAGALVFAELADAFRADRAVRSHVLTALARAVYASSNEPRREPRESEVRYIGTFVSEIIERYPEMHVEWMEDMRSGDPVHDIARQPTAVIRGVLLSPSLDHRRTVRFWELSLVAERFPVRVFSDPCMPDEGDMFSSYHLRAFAVVFSTASDEVVRKYATHMREHAVTQLVREWDEERHVPMIVKKRVGANLRHRAFAGIVGHVRDDARRHLVAELLQVRPSVA